MQTQSETFKDELIGFTIPSRNARGRSVRLDGVLNDVLSAHDYPPTIAHLLSEALVLCVLMGGLLKPNGKDAQLTMQAQSQTGAVSLLVCDYRRGSLRGYADFDAEALEMLGANPSIAKLFGDGYLAITFETSKDQRYQGIVPLEGVTLADAVEIYFTQSEQVPTLVRTASGLSGAHQIAGGLLVQHMADSEEGRERLHVREDQLDWEHVATMAASVTHEEMTKSDISLEEIVWRLFNEEEEVRLQEVSSLTKGCRCNKSHYSRIISRFPIKEQDAMRNEDGVIQVDCAFCSKVFDLRRPEPNCARATD